MKYVMDFVTNSSSGSTIASFKAILRLSDVTMARQAFGLSYIYKDIALPDEEIADEATEEPDDPMAGFWDGRPSDLAETTLQPDLVEETHFGGSGQIAVDLLSMTNSTLDEDESAEIALSSAIKNFLDETMPTWTPAQIDLYKEKAFFWEDFLRWLDRVYHLPCRAADLVIESDESFIAHGESSNKVVDKAMDVLYLGAARAIVQTLREKMSSVLYSNRDYHDLYSISSTDNGLFTNPVSTFSLDGSVSETTGGSLFTQLLEDLVREAGLDIGAIGLDPVLLKELYSCGLNLAAENLLRKRKASLLFASRYYKNIIIWFGDECMTREYLGVDSLVLDLGLTFLPEDHIITPAADTPDILQPANAVFNRGFVFLGGLSSMSLAEATGIVLALGGNVTPDIGPQTSYLVLASQPGSPCADPLAGNMVSRAKNLQRQGQDIQILSERDFLILISR